MSVEMYPQKKELALEGKKLNNEISVPVAEDISYCFRINLIAGRFLRGYALPSFLVLKQMVTYKTHVT